MHPRNVHRSTIIVAQLHASIGRQPYEYIEAKWYMRCVQYASIYFIEINQFSVNFLIGFRSFGAEIINYRITIYGSSACPDSSSAVLYVLRLVAYEQSASHIIVISLQVNSCFPISLICCSLNIDITCRVSYSSGSIECRRINPFRCKINTNTKIVHSVYLYFIEKSLIFQAHMCDYEPIYYKIPNWTPRKCITIGNEFNINNPFKLSFRQLSLAGSS